MFHQLNEMCHINLLDSLPGTVYLNRIINNHLKQVTVLGKQHYNPLRLHLRLLNNNLLVVQTLVRKPDLTKS